jgi:Holliday junction resolvasome RuvABC endonuclease subunit
MDINTQLNKSTAAKLAHLQQMTNQNLEEILQQAIDVYYQQFQTQSKTLMEILQDNGFVGCIQAESNLSVNYKPLIQRLVQERNDHR